MMDYNEGDATQKFAYEIHNGKAVVCRCFSHAEKAEIPRMIEGYPVVAIAPYAFSEHMDEKNLIGKKYTSEEELPVLCGDCVEEVWIPDTVRTVGRYCFYDCKNLKKISFTDTLEDWGSGAFTRCHHVEQLEIHIYKDGQTTLKDVLMELPELIYVDYYLESKDGAFAHLVFPEYYEEGIENTPARLINHEMHGSGMFFRNCFRQRVLSFTEYDSRFNHAGFQETISVLSELVLGRLRYPFELSERACRQYEAFVIEKKEVFSRFIIEKKQMDLLIWYVEFLTKLPEAGILDEVFQEMTEASLRAGFHEGLSYLMDYQHLHGKKRKKRSFDL